MRIALIPPVPDLDKFATGTGFHLLLSHLFEINGYCDYYLRRSEIGDYIVLDNSAHEFGRGNDMQRLLREAERVRADEVVVPDALFDSRGTVQKAREALKWLNTPQGSRAYARAGRPRLMLVPQGHDRPEWRWSLKHLLEAYWDWAGDARLSPVIGVSKDYYYWPRGLVSLIKDEVGPYRDTYPDLDVHCLGWPTDLWQLAYVARELPWVRSTDSAKPLVYAKNYILLEPGGEVPKYPRRDERYFHDPLDASTFEYAWRNIEVFRAAARDQLILKK